MHVCTKSSLYADIFNDRNMHINNKKKENAQISIPYPACNA